jgi:hypothetical protein
MADLTALRLRYTQEEPSAGAIAFAHQAEFADGAKHVLFNEFQLADLLDRYLREVAGPDVLRLCAMVEARDRALRKIIAQAGIPDPVEACRAIIKTADAALADKGETK